jgi:c-di-GMP-binding flagellar brake protein YcgR
MSFRGKKKAEGHLVNLSQGGMQIRTEDSVEAAKPLQISFDLPGARSSLKAQAEVVWKDKQGNVGIRFVKIAPHEQRTLQLWMAQQYFAN